MSEIEKIILIARAVGISLDTEDSDNPRKVVYFREVYPNYESWNPLRFNDDALYVAVDLGLNIQFFVDGEFPDHVRVTGTVGKNSTLGVIEAFDDDKFAATRRAIVAVAVETSLRAYGEDPTNE